MLIDKKERKFRDKVIQKDIRGEMMKNKLEEIEAERDKKDKDNIMIKREVMIDNGIIIVRNKDIVMITMIEKNIEDKTHMIVISKETEKENIEDKKINNNNMIEE